MSPFLLPPSRDFPQPDISVSLQILLNFADFGDSSSEGVREVIFSIVLHSSYRLLHLDTWLSCWNSEFVVIRFYTGAISKIELALFI